MFIQAIKRHIKAKNPKALERAMLLNNMKHGTWFDYQIVHDGKEWYAWFLKEENAFEALKNEVKRDNE